MATWRPTRRSKNLKLGMRRGSGMLCGGKYCCVVVPHLQKGALITTCDETQEQRRTSVENNSVGNLCKLELQRQKEPSPIPEHIEKHTYAYKHNSPPSTLLPPLSEANTRTCIHAVEPKLVAITTWNQPKSFLSFMYAELMTIKRDVHGLIRIQLRRIGQQHTSSTSSVLLIRSSSWCTCSLCQ